MTSPVPDSLLQQIVATYRPLRVILFGSHARGEAGAESDLDLMVVLDDDAPAEALHWRKLNEARRGYRGPVDILACRDADLEGRRNIKGSFAATILREGVTVYER
jgi:predicted nucleotidyltransferase